MRYEAMSSKEEFKTSMTKRKQKEGYANIQ